MVDTSATHNFVTEERVKDFYLNYVSSDTLLKTINALPTTFYGFTPKALIGLKGLKGLTDFSIASIDVFDNIFALDFLYEINTFILLSLNQLHINYIWGSWAVPLIRVPQNKMHFPPLHIVKGVKKVHQPFLLLLSEALKTQLRQ